MAYLITSDVMFNIIEKRCSSNKQRHNAFCVTRISALAHHISFKSVVARASLAAHDRREKKKTALLRRVSSWRKTPRVNVVRRGGKICWRHHRRVAVATPASRREQRQHVGGGSAYLVSCVSASSYQTPWRRNDSTAWHRNGDGSLAAQFAPVRYRSTIWR